MLLLHLLSALYPDKVRAIYVDHQLQAPSQAWGTFVAAQCQQLGIPCIIEQVQVASGNLEQQARTARYQAYQQHLGINDVLVLAHHQQDQAETVILRLLSGSGVTGLAAMKAYEKRKTITIWRPLLSLTREQICQWAAQLQIEHVVDPTNTDLHYDRAWCREALWPLLQQRFPQMQQALNRSSYLMQDAEEILQQVLQQDLTACRIDTGLDLTRLEKLSLARQRQLLSAWMKGDDQYRPSLAMVERLQKEVIASKHDAQAKLHWNRHYYLRYQQQLYRIPVETFIVQEQTLSNMMIQFVLNQSYTLLSGQYNIETATIGLSFDLLEQPLQLNARVGGEKVHLYGRIGTWPLKKAIQEAQILPWQRHTIQILSVDNVILGIFTPKGFWLAQSPYCETGGWQPHWVAPK